ncbi:ABC transporter ATP-binding protein [Streptomyces sp. MS2.AVA.5]|uniref:ABC transporter ATP-binding protein n=1 Tax=Streptomyces achmelvichensis TaxID=3134111 RepID=A0ACC6PMG1_9ACTN
MIDVESVSARFGGRTALTEACFAADDGELICLTGHHGSGKTTLLRLLAGLAKPTTGQVRIDGHAATDHAARSVCGFAQEEPALYGFLTVREHLAYDCALHGIRLQPILERLQDTLLEGRHDLLVRDLSPGMRKQLGLLAATLHDPTLVLLDEPTKGLDATAVSDLRTTLRGWRAQRKTVIVCTQNPAWVTDLANRLVILRDGHIMHDVRVADETVTTALLRLDPHQQI